MDWGLDFGSTTWLSDPRTHSVGLNALCGNQQDADEF